MCTPRLQFSLRSSPPIDMPFDGAFEAVAPITMPHDYDHHPNLPQAASTGENDVEQHSAPEDSLSFANIHFPWHSDQLYHDPGVHVGVNPIQSPHNLGLWSLSDAQQVAEVSPPPSSSMVSYSLNGPGQNFTQCDGHISFNTSWPTPSGRQPLLPLADQESDTLRHLSLDPPSAYQFSHSSHMMYSPYPSSPNDENVHTSFIPHHALSYHLLHPASTRLSTRVSTGFLGTDSLSHMVSHRVQRRDFSGTSRHKRAARALQYDGISVDEEELLKGLMEPDGKLTVHQCRWEEDRSPCHLWIRGDESCINLHIQKWHGGKPGGDNRRIDCRWSACGKTMRKDSIARHIVTVHLGEVWECQGCGKGIVRGDAYRQHAVRSNFDPCRTAGALITYLADARVIDVRTVLDNGGYAGA